MNTPVPKSIQHFAVQITRFANGESQLVAAVRFEDGNVSMEGDAEMLEELRAGVYDPLARETVTPEDGLLFLAALPLVYKNPYLFASEVEDV